MPTFSKASSIFTWHVTYSQYVGNFNKKSKKSGISQDPKYVNFVGIHYK